LIISKRFGADDENAMKTDENHEEV